MPKIKPFAMWMLLFRAGCSLENDARLTRIAEQSLATQAPATRPRQPEAAK